MIVNNIECAYNNPLIEIVKFACGYTAEITYDCNEILFVLEGKVQYTTHCDYPDGEVKEGEFIFLPACWNMSYTTICDSTLLIIRIHGGFRMGFSLEQLYSEDSNFLVENKITVLKLSYQLWHFAIGLKDFLNDELKNDEYFKLKISEFFILLRSHYTREQLRRFFYPILSPNIAFTEYVRTNHQDYKTVADLSASMNMTAKQFSKIFKEIFKQPPYAWMKNEKSKLLLSEIRNTEKSFKQIAFDYGFSVPTQFSRYCKDNFGKTPLEIRGEAQNRFLK